MQVKLKAMTDWMNRCMEEISDEIMNPFEMIITECMNSGSSDHDL